MKKFLYIFYLAAAVNLSAATLNTVAFHPVPSGKYAQLFISGQTVGNTPGGVIANGLLNIYRMDVPGSLTISSSSPDGSLKIVGNTPDGTGIFQINNGGVLSALYSAYLQLSPAAYGYGDSFLNYKNSQNRPLQVQTVKTVAWQAYDTNVSPSHYSFPALPAVPTGMTLRWLKIRGIVTKDEADPANGVPEGSEKQWIVLTASSNSAAINAACNASFTLGTNHTATAIAAWNNQLACCYDSANPGCRGAGAAPGSDPFSWAGNGYYNVAIGAAGVSMTPDYPAYINVNDGNYVLRNVYYNDR